MRVVVTLDCCGSHGLRDSFLDFDYQYEAVVLVHAATFLIDSVTWIRVAHYPFDYEYKKRNVYIDICTTAIAAIRHQRLDRPQTLVYPTY